MGSYIANEIIKKTGIELQKLGFTPADLMVEVQYRRERSEVIEDYTGERGPLIEQWNRDPRFNPLLSAIDGEIIYELATDWDSFV